MSQEDRPSNPPPDSPSLRVPEKNEKLMTTLAGASDRERAHARAELRKVMEDKAATETTPSPYPSSMTPTTEARNEVTEAAVKFTDGVDVITETLILILGKFRAIIWRTTLGMIFGGFVLITCLLAVHQAQKTSLAQERSAEKIADLANKFEDALRRLDKIQASANSTEQKVDAVKQTADSKPSIEIVPDTGRPGSAKVVIRSAANPPRSPPPSSPVSGGKAPHAPPAMSDAADVLEIPIQLGSAPAPAPKRVRDTWR